MAADTIEPADLMRWEDDGGPPQPPDPFGMTDAEKVEGFEQVALALTKETPSHWWAAETGSVPGGPVRQTRAEAVADLVAWARRVNQRRARRGGK